MMRCLTCSGTNVTRAIEGGRAAHTVCADCGDVDCHEKIVGTQEGERCGRDLCSGIIELLPDTSDGGGCSCHIAPPCGFCTSTMPECPVCGWREEE